MTISIQEMKDILSTAMQNNSNSNLQDCNINCGFDCINLYNTIIGHYPLIGFECNASVGVNTAISSGIYNQVLDNEMEVFSNQLEGVDIDDMWLVHENDWIDYWIEITTEYQNNTIKAFVSAGNGKHELLSEPVDTSSIEAFTAQCEKFVSVL